jgi:integrase
VLQRARRRVLAATGIPPARQFGFHGLRRTLLTWLASENGMIASIVAGHAGGVTQQFYVNPSAVAALMDRVPQP